MIYTWCLDCRSVGITEHSPPTHLFLGSVCSFYDFSKPSSITHLTEIGSLLFSYSQPMKKPAQHSSFPCSDAAFLSPDCGPFIWTQRPAEPWDTKLCTEVWISATCQPLAFTALFCSEQNRSFSCTAVTVLTSQLMRSVFVHSSPPLQRIYKNC